ncbi:phage tail length tape measure family protein [Paraburkholderia bryophila]|uniref:Phage-related minor tail protein n=1 Tax=Paraburkholderia bryophila TaxID=420952 RepID=A0A7Y9W3V0_9BURK|nr:phage tail length tape measure family protein [Paraburkholderia bryophila]NYH13427.1 phage-related minor tail protein [Paraburkholderia bryophila]
MSGTSGSLGQLVVQLTMDPSSYNANMRGASSTAGEFGSSVGKSSKAAAEGMDKIGAHTVAARRELVVMGHEVLTGSWKNLAGSAMVFAEQIDAMSLIMSPAGLAVGALTGVIAAFGVAVYKGHQEQEAFNKSLQVTGNYAGQTTSSFAAMTQSIAAATGDGLGPAREGLQALVSSGQVTGQSLELLGQAVVRMHDLTGQKLDDIAKDYARMPEGVAKWAEEHNRSMHFITTAQYEYIQRLEETGDKQGAMLVVAQALDTHLRNESLQNLGALEKAWRGVGNAISGAWDWMKSIGRAQTSAEAIASATADIQRLQNALNGPALPDTRRGWTQQLDAARAKLDALNRDALREQDRATTAATDAQTQQSGISASDFLKKLHDQEKGISRVNQALDEYRRKVGDFNKANPANPVSAQQQAKDEASIREQYADKSGLSEANKLRKSLLDAALQRTKNSLDLIQSSYKNADDQLQALHKATLISDQAFYTAEITLADDAAQKQIAAYEQEKKTLQAAYWKAPADERIRITQEIGDVDTKIARVRQDNAAKDMVYVTQQTDAQRKYLKSITDTRDALLAQAGVSTPKAMHDFDERNRGAMLQAATTGDISGAAFLDQDRQLTKLSAQYSDVIAQAKDAQNKISLDQQQGLTGLVDGFSQLRANSADTVSSLQQLYDEVNKLSWQTTDEGVLRNLDQLRDRIRQSMLDSSNYLKDFTDAGRSAFSGLFQDIAEGTKTPAQAIKSMVASMLGSFAQLFANKAYTSLLGTLFDGLSASAGGTGNSAYGFTMGSSIQGSGSLYGVGAGIFRATGGLVSGPGTATSDSILAHLSDGEYVVKASAVSQPGVLSLLESINGGGAGSRNRFALGGYVGSAPMSSAAAMPSLALSIPVTVDACDGGDTSQSSPRVKDLMSGLSDKIRATLKDETRPGGIIYLFYKNGR